jgi:hypothetical protein
MKSLHLQQRCDFYAQAFPWPPPRTDQDQSAWLDGDRWISGVWVLGNDYRGSGYYGAYPPNFVKRVMALFPDAQKVLHLFSGSLPPGPYTRFDIQGSNADIIGDAHELSKYFGTGSFDLILADPPYTGEDANHYGTPMIRRNKVLAECATILQPEGFLVWLDQVLPMFHKRTLHLCGAIGIVRSTNHRFRVASIFKKLGAVAPEWR